MDKRVLITFTCFSEKYGKSYQIDFAEKDKVSAARMFLGYRPKKNYEVVQVIIDYVEGLV